MDTPRTTENPLEKARQRAGLSLLGLSDQAGIPRTTLRRRINNLKSLTLGEIESLAAVLGEDPDELSARIIGGEAA